MQEWKLINQNDQNFTEIWKYFSHNNDTDILFCWCLLFDKLVKYDTEWDLPVDLTKLNLKAIQ